MTFLGKIFTVLIFAMSLVFMGIASAVFVAHKNWPTIAQGMEAKINDAQTEIKKLTAEKEQLLTQISSEQLTRRILLSRSEDLRLQLVAASIKSADELKKQMELAATASADSQAKTNLLAALSKELDAVRTKTKALNEEITQTTTAMVSSTDQVGQLTLLLARMEGRAQELAAQLAELHKVAEAHGLKPSTPIDNIPPRLESIVTAVQKEGKITRVTIKIGSDDGLRVGHPLNVFRGNDYVGRIEVIKVEPNRSVAQSDPKYLVRPIEEQDLVYTITPTASLNRQARTGR